MGLRRKVSDFVHDATSSDTPNPGDTGTAATPTPPAGSAAPAAGTPMGAAPVSPLPARGDQAAPRPGEPGYDPNAALRNSTPGPHGVDATGGVDLTDHTIQAQRALIAQGAAWKFDASKIDLPKGMDSNAVYPTRDAAITVYLASVRSGSGATQSIDSSTNQPDSGGRSSQDSSSQ